MLEERRRKGRWWEEIRRKFLIFYRNILRLGRRAELNLLIVCRGKNMSLEPSICIGDQFTCVAYAEKGVVLV